MSNFLQRVVGAAALQPQIYEEVEADGSATVEALAVVILSSVASGIGGGYATGAGLSRSAGAALMGWLIWAAITYVVGTKILSSAGTVATWGELLRTTGFAASPGLLNIFGVLPIPFLAGLLFFATSIWMLVAFVVAVRQALDYTTMSRAVAVCIVGWIIYMVFRLLIF